MRKAFEIYKKDLKGYFNGLNSAGWPLAVYLLCFIIFATFAIKGVANSVLDLITKLRVILESVLNDAKDVIMENADKFINDLTGPEAGKVISSEYFKAFWASLKQQFADQFPQYQVQLEEAVTSASAILLKNVIIGAVIMVLGIIIAIVRSTVKSIQDSPRKMNKLLRVIEAFIFEVIILALVALFLFMAIGQSKWWILLLGAIAILFVTSLMNLIDIKMCDRHLKVNIFGSIFRLLYLQVFVYIFILIIRWVIGSMPIAILICLPVLIHSVNYDVFTIDVTKAPKEPKDKDIQENKDKKIEKVVEVIEKKPQDVNA